jgi:hypothetical protein
MLQMIDPQEKFLVRGTIDRTAIISHVRSVLVNFAAKGKHSKFYVGITGSLDTRLRQHRIEKPDFRLMVPVFEEPAQYHADALDHVERDMIAALRGGIVHPDTNRTVLTCANGPGGSVAKRCLYLLLG